MRCSAVRPSATIATSNHSGRILAGICYMPSEICIDSFQANRAPDLRYRTAPIGALFTHFKGGFYHDGRFPTLSIVVDHYDTCMALGLTSDEKSDLIQYLLILPFVPKGSTCSTG